LENAEGKWTSDAFPNQRCTESWDSEVKHSEIFMEVISPKPEGRKTAASKISEALTAVYM